MVGLRILADRCYDILATLACRSNGSAAAAAPLRRLFYAL